MSKDEKVQVTAEEGQTLFRVAIRYTLPEKLGEQSYDVAERGIANDEIRSLFRELRSHSPLYLTKERTIAFGPVSAWKKTPEFGKNGWELEDQSSIVEIRVSDDARSGAYWCLLALLHPASGLIAAPALQEEVLWPLAKKLRLVGELEKAIGTDDEPARRLELDELPQDQEKAEKA